MAKGENPQINPAIPRAIGEGTSRRSDHCIATADTTGRRKSSTLNEATGPTIHVTGARSRARPQAVVFAKRFMPWGANTPDEKRGELFHVQKWATKPFAQMEIEASPSGHTVERRRPLARRGDMMSSDKKA